MVVEGYTASAICVQKVFPHCLIIPSTKRVSRTSSQSEYGVRQIRVQRLREVSGTEGRSNVREDLS